MKFLYLLLLLMPSCKPHEEPTKHTPEQEARIEHLKDSILKSDKTIDDIYFRDTAAAAKGPVHIISASPTTRAYSGYKDIHLIYKNVSGKDISAIRFRWYGENAFGEPADMGSSEGFGGGFADQELRAGKSDYGTWTLLSKDLKRVVKAWAYEVVFTDGTRWYP